PGNTWLLTGPQNRWYPGTSATRRAHSCLPLGRHLHRAGRPPLAFLRLRRLVELRETLALEIYQAPLRSRCAERETRSGDLPAVAFALPSSTLTAGSMVTPWQNRCRRHAARSRQVGSLRSSSRLR